MTATVPAHMSFGGPQRASEQDLLSRPPTSLVPHGVQLLAVAMIEAAWQDLHDTQSATRRPRYWQWRQNAGYRPDPESARAWFLELGDRPRGHLPFVLCCQALRLDPEAIRTRCFAVAPIRGQGRKL